MAKGEHGQALPILLQLLEKDPSNASIHSDLAAIYAKQRRWDSAVEAYLRAQKLAPNRAEHHWKLAELYFENMGKFADAEQEIEAAFVLAPHDLTIWNVKGNLLHVQGKI